QCGAFTKRCHIARFADSGLAGNQHDLSLASPRQLLAREHEFDFCRAANEADRSPRSHRLEPALRFGCTFDRPDFDWFGNAFYFAVAEIAKREQIAEQPARRRGNDNGSWLRQTLKPGSDVRRITDHALLL